MASRMEYSLPPPTTQEPKPMEVDAIKHATYSRRAPSVECRKPVAPKRLHCFRFCKPGHHAAVCRAHAPVLAVAASDVTVKAADQPNPEGNHVYGDGASRPLRALVDSGASNKFVHADSLPVLPSRLRVRES
ncbi:unnamed protein product [Peronospora belbahrii]|uniref:Peptidase A2 domain-containing protein n=1 Tax=Peronospora belbahrii TaxID=622444 RepID=A0AAU9LA16_9STRA|nr:unnamed protein product [Peronospora belbahrii]